MSTLNETSTERTPICPALPRWSLALLWGLVLLALGGCAAMGPSIFQPMGSLPPEAQAEVPRPELLPDGVTLLVSDPQESPELGETGVPTATAGVTETVQVDEPPQVTVRNRSVNIRSGPGLDFPVVAGARRGDTFQVVGRDEEGDWWLICCIPGPDDEPDQPTQRAWIADIVVTANPAAAQAPVFRPLFPEELEAQWSVSYRCDSERCPVRACQGTMAVAVTRTNARWLELERTVTWDGDCGEDSTWIHQIDRYTGEERYATTEDIFTLRYWAGRTPGPVNAEYRLGEDQAVAAWCSPEQEAELEEAEGWITDYRGIACYDAQLGMLLAMKYEKRWLFSGEYEGEVYERAYFGDRELYEIQLLETNAPLTPVE